MERIGLKTIQNRLLKIADVFDRICSRHDIPYYMVGGTMLGAIRHKGFIPWDDDMDFGVPLKHYHRLINILEEELPEGMRCCTFENCEAVFYSFFKIEDTRTCIDDPRVNLPIDKKLGVNIDVFPLTECNKYSKETERARKMQRLQTLLFVDSTEGGKMKSLVKKTLRTITPFGKEYLPQKMLSEISKTKPGQDIANVFGRWGIKESVDKEWYGNGVRYDFENLKLCGLKEYDKYLTQMYGEYMQLPPESQQVAHVNNVYIKEII